MTKQLEFDFEENQKIKKQHFGGGADIVGTLDDPYHEPFLGCTKDPKTCENFLICFCEEEQNRLRKKGIHVYEDRYWDDNLGRWFEHPYDEKGGNNEKK
ncbi:MAG TPA: hypothetical protein DCM10_15440 [Xanthomarina gelatinilytica]|nr:hypothetical protein [Xanthomarina gelatinilytica]|tara:strand:+ start:122 stop:418 length:297 start_codon:yes stop_codon:yes gene_type:complete